VGKNFEKAASEKKLCIARSSPRPHLDGLMHFPVLAAKPPEVRKEDANPHTGGSTTPSRRKKNIEGEKKGEYESSDSESRDESRVREAKREGHRRRTKRRSGYYLVGYCRKVKKSFKKKKGTAQRKKRAF